jgi:hypothetical protein
MTKNTQYIPNTVTSYLPLRQAVSYLLESNTFRGSWPKPLITLPGLCNNYLLRTSSPTTGQILPMSSVLLFVSRTPLIRTLVIPIADYPDRLRHSRKFVENSTKVTCLEISGYRVKYSTVLWLLKLQIRRSLKVNINSRTSNCQSGLFSNKNPIMRIFWISGRLAVPINPDKWSSSICALVLQSAQKQNRLPFPTLQHRDWPHKCWKMWRQ